MAQCLQNTSLQCLDYEAAEAKLRHAREEARLGCRAAEAVGDADGVARWSDALRTALSSFKEFRESLSREELLCIHGERILATYHSDASGLHRLTVPGGVSDLEALQALNACYVNVFPASTRGIISDRYLTWFADQKDVCARKVSESREIAIHLDVPDTCSVDRTTQQAVLLSKNLVFADPIEQMLIAAAHACTRDLGLPFPYLYLRGSDPGVALRRDRIEGFILVAVPDALGKGVSIAASGRPAAA
jgi:hypothetical protein